MSGKRPSIIITGANGYLGARLSLYFAAQGWAVTAICFPDVPKDEIWCSKMERVITANLTNSSEVDKLAQKQYDVMVHLVSLDHHASNSGDPYQVASVNISPVWGLLDKFSKNGLKHFIYFSTMQVYGRVEDGEIVDENRESRPVTPYALTHLIGEEFCKYYAANSQTKCSVVRLSNSYGAPIFSDNNCWWLVVNDLCKTALLEQSIVLQSDGSPMRDFIHGNDVCRAVECITQKQQKSYECYNVSSGQTLTILELAKKVAEVYGGDLKITSSVGDLTIKEPNRYTISNEKLRSLGFQSMWNIEQGVEDLFNYLKKQRN